MTPVSQPGAAAEHPAKCPACGSRALVTTGKVADPSSYWRCESCGEVWNAGRLREASRHAYDRPFGRR